MKRFAAVIALAAAGSVIIASNPASADVSQKVKADVSPNRLKTSFSRGHSGPHPLDIARLFIDIVDIAERSDCYDDWDYGPPPPPPPRPRWRRPPPPPPRPRFEPRPGPGPRPGRPGPRFRPAPRPRGPRPAPRPSAPRGPRPGPRPGGPGTRGIRPPRR